MHPICAEVAAGGAGWGTRRVDLEELYTNKAGKPFALKPGEILTAIFVPNRRRPSVDTKNCGCGAPLTIPSWAWPFRYSGTGPADWPWVPWGPRPYGVEIKQPSPRNAVEAAVSKRSWKQVKACWATRCSMPTTGKEMITVLAERLINKVMEGSK